MFALEICGNMPTTEGIIGSPLQVRTPPFSFLAAETGPICALSDGPFLVLTGARGTGGAEYGECASQSGVGSQLVVA